MTDMNALAKDIDAKNMPTNPDELEMDAFLGKDPVLLNRSHGNQALRTWEHCEISLTSIAILSSMSPTEFKHSFLSLCTNLYELNHIYLQGYNNFSNHPMKVISHEDGVYRIRDLYNHTDMDVHVSRLSPFLYDPNRVDPESVAYRDHDAFKVQKIVAFKHFGPRKYWQAKVRYEGCDETQDEWISWREAHKMEQMHNYLQEHNLQKLIPLQYRTDDSS